MKIVDKQAGKDFYIREDQLAIQRDEKTGMEFLINMDQIIHTIHIGIPCANLITYTLSDFIHCIRKISYCISLL